VLLDFVPILIYFVIMVGLALIIIGLSHLLSPRGRGKAAVFEEPYECGLPSEGAGPERYPIKFYLVSILFVLFDVEAVFLWPWAISFQSYRASGFTAFWYIEMVVFLAILLVGYLYLIGKGAFDWK
jgi:NADH-quinone oxidoreductase subunit A